MQHIHNKHPRTFCNAPCVHVLSTHRRRHDKSLRKVSKILRQSLSHSTSLLRPCGRPQRKADQARCTSRGYSRLSHEGILLCNARMLLRIHYKYRYSPGIFHVSSFASPLALYTISKSQKWRRTEEFMRRSLQSVCSRAEGATLRFFRVGSRVLHLALRYRRGPYADHALSVLRRNRWSAKKTSGFHHINSPCFNTTWKTARFSSFALKTLAYEDCAIF